LQDCYRNVNLMDIYPTLIDLCNLPEKKLDGKSFKPLLKNPAIEWTPTVTTYNQGNHSVMSEKWHYISYARGVEELYNIENDPMEWTNLVNNGSSATEEVKKKLKLYLPVVNAEVIKSDKGEGSDTDKKSKTPKEVDATLKAKRNLNKLK